jgi:hypothetical protein
MRFMRYVACISALPAFHMYAPPAEDIMVTFNIRPGTLIGMTTGIAMGAYRNQQISKKSKNSRPLSRSLENLNLFLCGFAGGIIGSDFSVATLEDVAKTVTVTVGRLLIGEKLAYYPKIMLTLLIAERIAPKMYALGRSVAAGR